MPMLVVGADTRSGDAIASRMLQEGGEVRVFVTDLAVAERLRSAGAKVALGDVSDASHVEGAATGAHTVVLVAEALVDARERAFEADPGQLGRSLVAAARDAGAKRIIWVGPDPPHGVVLVRDGPDVVDAVVAADAAR